MKTDETGEDDKMLQELKTIKFTLWLISWILSAILGTLLAIAN